MKDISEQIRAMLESGFSNAQIKNFLDVTDEDIESATNSQQEEESKLETPETSETPEAPEAHKLKRAGQNGTKINEESFKPIKHDIESGVKRLEIRRKFNISDALYYRIKKSQTYEDFCNIRKIEAGKKRKQAYSFKVGDGEYHPRTREPKYTEELWNEGKKMHNLGVPYREIAARQGFSMNFIAKALRLPSYDALVNERKKEQARRKAEFEKTKTLIEAEEKMDMQLDEVVSSEPKQEEQPADNQTVDTATPEKARPRADEFFDPKLFELRSMADSLARIAEAFEKIASQPKKRGLFRK